MDEVTSPAALWTEADVIIDQANAGKGTDFTTHVEMEVGSYALFRPLLRNRSCVLTYI